MNTTDSHNLRQLWINGSDHENSFRVVDLLKKEIPNN